MELIYKDFPAKRISPLDGIYFYGYYDIQPFCKDLHLAHKVSFMDRVQKRGDMARVGLLDVNTSKFECLDATEAWNFQQGAMLQWMPGSDEEIVYNCILGSEYAAVIHNIRTGHKRYLEKPVANLSPKGDYALSINFSRLYDFRAGYGYASIADPFYHDNHSDKDGIWLTDLKTGKSRLIISLDRIWEFCGGYFKGVDKKIVINHITFNTDGSRFLFILRDFPEPDKRHMNALITANTDGSDMFLLSDFGMQSHYHWIDPERVIFFSDGKELACCRDKAHNYILRDKTYEGELVADGFFCRDNHMSFSADRKLLLNDTYPDANKMQHLRIASIEKDVCVEIGSYYALINPSNSWSCDLHPCWNRDGSRISFDSTHEGIRGIYMVEVDPIRKHIDSL